MRTKLYRIAAVLMILVLCTVGTAGIACAGDSLSAKVPVKISLKGPQTQAPEKFAVTLKADEPGSPMPEGSANGVCTHYIAGAGEDDFYISYDKLGVYTYTLYQEAGTNEHCTYDGSVYRITVYVVNAEDGNGFETAVAIYRNNESSKADEAVFSNEYEVIVPPAEKPDAPKTGDNINMGLWGILMAASALAMVYIVAGKRRKQKEM